MKFEINSNAFYTAVNAAAKLIAKNKEYTGIEVKTLDGQIQITGYKQENNITGTYPAEAKIIEEGSVVVPGKFTANIIKELPPGNITVNENKNALVLSFGSGRSISVKKMINDEQKSIPMEKEGKVTCKVKFDNMTQVVAKALSALQEKSKNPIFESVFFNIEQQKDETLIEVVSTDTRSLHRQVALGQAEGTGQFVVPSPFMSECLELLRISTDTPVLTFTENHKIIFSCKQGRIVSNQMKANYPDWKLIVPQEGPAADEYKNSITAMFEVTAIDTLKEILGRAMTCSDQKNNTSLIVVKPGVMKVVHISDHGQLIDELPITMKGKKPIGVVMNTKRYYESIKQLSGVYISLITEANQPVYAEEAIKRDGKYEFTGFKLVNVPIADDGKYKAILEEILNEQPALNFGAVTSAQTGSPEKQTEKTQSPTTNTLEETQMPAEETGSTGQAPAEETADQKLAS